MSELSDEQVREKLPDAQRERFDILVAWEHDQDRFMPGPAENELRLCRALAQAIADKEAAKMAAVRAM